MGELTKQSKLHITDQVLRQNFKNCDFVLLFNDLQDAPVLN
ncbi:MAG: hypothetical protein ACJAX5_001860 [Patiriisocius sp.]|jgi:hypothetical protein